MKIHRVIFLKLRRKQVLDVLSRTGEATSQISFGLDVLKNIFPYPNFLLYFCQHINKMRTILLHPGYFPSIAHMSCVAKAEKVVFERHDNYQKQTYRNRAYIAHSNGELLLNIPIQHSKNGIRQKFDAVNVENDFPWQDHHWKSLQSAYRTSPFFEFYEDDLEEFFILPVENLLQHNLDIFDRLLEIIGIEVEISHTETYERNPDLTDLRFLINAKKQIDFTPENYTQVHQANHPFLPNLSVLDLLFNEGPNALNYLESQNTDGIFSW